ncbi:MAG: hypothetical protein CXZ00_15830 [Acidobacteria bacterium]|nr:MAG: hypothetical protein CXZ00_15830 [Acidobacteriota bacterium]
MSDSIPSTSSGENEAHRALQEFIGDTDLQQLEILLGKFNLFETLKLVWHEVRHSDFLAYLLNPQQNHGLGDAFLKAVLQEALKGQVAGVTPIDIDVWNLTTAEVHREWKNIDIFIRDESNHLAVIIENKIQSTEHDNQLARYYKCVTEECAGCKIVPIYLTIEREPPSDERYTAMGYDQISQLIENLIALRRNTIIVAAEVVSNSHDVWPRRINGWVLETKAFGEERRAGETTSCREDIGAFRRGDASGLFLPSSYAFDQ